MKVCVFLILSIMTLKIYADDCAECNQKKPVGGAPLVGNNLEKIANAVAKDSGADDGLTPEQIENFDDICGWVNDNVGHLNFKAMLEDKLKRYKNISVALRTNLCSSLQFEKIKTPMIQITADNSIARDNAFFNKIAEYYLNDIKKPDEFKKILNAKNSRGHTFLEYVEFIYNNATTADTEKNAYELLYYLGCAYGGELSSGESCYKKALFIKGKEYRDKRMSVKI